MKLLWQKVSKSFLSTFASAEICSDEHGQIVFFFAAASLPNLFIIWFGAIFHTPSITELPELLKILASISLVPWIETAFFFLPLRFVVSDGRVVRNLLWILIAAIIFVFMHKIVRDDDVVASLMVFWFGLVQAAQYSILFLRNQPATTWVACTHALYNLIVYSTLACTVLIASTGIGRLMQILFISTFYILLILITFQILRKGLKSIFQIDLFNKF